MLTLIKLLAKLKRYWVFLKEYLVILNSTALLNPSTAHLYDQSLSMAVVWDLQIADACLQFE
jgi:hypothetical protein